MNRFDVLELNLQVCRENADIMKNNSYMLNTGSDDQKEQRVTFAHKLQEHQKVIVYSPDQLDHLKKNIADRLRADTENHITVADEDSFATQIDCVLNFANAQNPGGGYLRGAVAQEEALCRQSTLYVSIASREARTMYEHNSCVADLDTRYLLVSPCVEVFRQRDLSLMEKTFTTAVITAAAPNLYGSAFDVSLPRLQEYYRERIQDILCAAADNGYRSITLGACGCGAFGNDPNEVAMAFRDVLVEDGYGKFFEQIRFAIPDRTSRNYMAFYEIMNRGRKEI